MFYGWACVPTDPCPFILIRIVLLRCILNSLLDAPYYMAWSRAGRLASKATSMFVPCRQTWVPVLFADDTRYLGDEYIVGDRPTRSYRYRLRTMHKIGLTMAGRVQCFEIPYEHKFAPG